MNNLKALLRPAMIFVPLTAGVLLPEAHILNYPPYNIVRWTLIGMMLISWLKIDYRQLIPRRQHVYLLIANILLGIIPFFLLKIAFPDHSDLALAAFFTGIAPAAAATPVVISFLGGNMGFALTGFMCSTLGISLAMFVLLPVTTGSFTMSFLANVLTTFAYIIALPFSVAWLIRKCNPNAQHFAGRLKTLSFSLWSVTLFSLASLGRQYFIDHPEAAGINVLAIAAVSVVMCILSFTVGRLLTKSNLKMECSQLLGQKNTSFVAYLALQFATPIAALSVIFYVFLQNLWNACQMYRHDSCKIEKTR